MTLIATSADFDWACGCARYTVAEAPCPNFRTSLYDGGEGRVALWNIFYLPDQVLVVPAGSERANCPENQLGGSVMSTFK